ncbi:FAD binding domain-containing protein (plasmid) [Streptomyces sp. NBC_01707]|uniref:FAD binding domain-containing protein n=1 Tax=Streptomyces sp. NBC_01707 TaxID=2975914 RepID=UPI002F914EA0
MKLPPFVHVAPSRLGDAVAHLAEAAPREALPLAGGQSLIPLMASRARTPRVLVDLCDLRELTGVTERDDCLVAGAMTRQHALAADPRIQDMVPLVADAAAYTGHASVRHRGTLGGTLSLAAPAAQLITAAHALDARLLLTGPGGDRECALRTWLRGPYTTGLRHGELLTAVALPLRRTGSGHALRQMVHPAGGRPVACVAAIVDTAPDGTVRRAELTVSTRVSTPSSVDVTARLAEASDSAEATVPADVEQERGAPPATYCRRAVRVLADQALTEAITRARRPDPRALLIPRWETP